MIDNHQFTPEEFVIWLHGYAAAKPDVLDEQTRGALHGVIAFLAGRKLRGLSERGRLDDVLKNTPGAGKIGPLWPPQQPSPTYAGSPTWVSTTGTAAPSPQYKLEPGEVVGSAPTLTIGVGT